MKGKVDGKNVSHVCLDPGSSLTFVRASNIDGKMIGELVEVTTVNPGQKNPH